MRGAVTRIRTLREVIRGNVAVLGDASGSVDAITGDGLLSAFRQANALADAIAAGEPKRYAAEHAHIAKAPQRMARMLLLLDRYPGLERRFVATMATRPESFAALLSAHAGEQSWPSFAWMQAAALLNCRRKTEDKTGRDTEPDIRRDVRLDKGPWLPYATKAHRERGL
jgi:flavin-dependent dehydrogenase